MKTYIICRLVGKLTLFARAIRKPFAALEVSAKADHLRLFDVQADMPVGDKETRSEEPPAGNELVVTSAE